MLGRTEQLDRIAAALRRADLVGVVLAGEAGVGKSTLLTAAVERAESEGFCVVRIFGSRATATLPLCAFSSLLEPGDVDQSVERFIAVRRALADRAGHRPLLIAIDDAHLLDDASAVLVSQMARELAAFVVCSLRTAEPAPEPISSLWVQGVAVLVTVDPLERDDAAALAAAALGGPVSPALEAELWRRTSGNPLFLRELALGSLASESVQLVNGMWTQIGPLAASDALADLVRARLGALSADEQHALCCVALSEPAGLGLIEAVAAPDALMALEEAGLVTVTQDRRRVVVRLSHPLYGEVVRAQTSQLRARKIRRALADAVTGFGARRRDDTLSVATWRLDCGDVDAAQFAAAAFDAIRRHDTDLAERLASAAHDHQPDDLTTRALAMTRHLLGRHEDALAVLRPAMDAAPAGSDAWARLGLLAGLINGRGVGDYPLALDILGAVERCDTSPRTLRRASAMIAMIDLLRADAASARTRAEALVAAGADEPEVYTAYVGSLAATGAPVAALAAARAFVERHGEPDPRSLFPDFSWVALAEMGALDEMGNQISSAWESATDLADRHRQGRAAMAMGHVLLDRGQAATARRWFETSAGLYRVTGERFGERWAHAGRLLASAQLGDVADADAAEAALALTPGHPASFFEIYGERGRALLAAVKGQPAVARQQLTELADRLLARGNVGHAMRALVDLARLGDPAAAAQRLDQLGPIDGHGLPAFADLIRALHTGRSDALGASANRLAELGYQALAAEAASAARDALAREGRARDASGMARRAAELMAGTEGGATPLFTVIDSVVPLTRREREIAALVAAGRTSREVADACFLSVRTVETHLARIYDKLGVRSRGELAEVMSSMTAGAAA